MYACRPKSCVSDNAIEFVHVYNKFQLGLLTNNQTKKSKYSDSQQQQIATYTQY